MNRFTECIILGLVAAVMVSLGEIPAAAQTVKRTAAGKPDLNGIWQVLNTAAQDLQDHNGELGIPPGLGVVEGDEIPYRPEALAKRQQNRANRKTADPSVANCYLPGVPRATYMPYPFEIVQTQDSIVIRYEFAHAVRSIPLGSKHAEGIPTAWMGDSRGHWEGDTLVVDVTNFNDDTWLGSDGYFHTEKMHVVERLTRNGDTITYTVEVSNPGSAFTADPYFAGMLDDCRVYRRALSAAEITALP